MLMTVAATIGLIIWIVLWSLGAKGFDAFMITTLVLVLGATVKMLLPALSDNRDE
jgi:hypothetical protein